MNTPQQAVYFAEHTTHLYHDHCLGFVCAAYGVACVHDTAYLAWAATRLRGLSYSPPLGYVVWWSGGREGAGHVALSVGGGYCLSTDFGPDGYVGDGRIRKVLISAIHQHDSLLTFRGWSRDLEGHTVVAAPPALPKVSLSKTQAAARLDPHRAQGGTTTGAAYGVKLVEQALSREGLLAVRYVDGSFGSLTVSAYAGWQHRLGYSGAAANGIPGSATLTALGKKHGFVVVS